MLEIRSKKTLYDNPNENNFATKQMYILAYKYILINTPHQQIIVSPLKDRPYISVLHNIIIIIIIMSPSPSQTESSMQMPLPKFHFE